MKIYTCAAAIFAAVGIMALCASCGGGGSTSDAVTDLPNDDGGDAITEPMAISDAAKAISEQLILDTSRVLLQRYGYDTALPSPDKVAPIFAEKVLEDPCATCTGPDEACVSDIDPERGKYCKSCAPYNNCAAGCAEGTICEHYNNTLGEGCCMPNICGSLPFTTTSCDQALAENAGSTTIADACTKWGNAHVDAIKRLWHCAGGCCSPGSEFILDDIFSADAMAAPCSSDPGDSILDFQVAIDSDGLSGSVFCSIQPAKLSFLGACLCYDNHVAGDYVLNGCQKVQMDIQRNDDGTSILHYEMRPDECGAQLTATIVGDADASASASAFTDMISSGDGFILGGVRGQIDLLIADGIITLAAPVAYQYWLTLIGEPMQDLVCDDSASYRSNLAVLSAQSAFGVGGNCIMYEQGADPCDAVCENTLGKCYVDLLGTDPASDVRIVDGQYQECSLAEMFRESYFISRNFYSDVDPGPMDDLIGQTLFKCSCWNASTESRYTCNMAGYHTCDSEFAGACQYGGTPCVDGCCIVQPPEDCGTFIHPVYGEQPVPACEEANIEICGGPEPDPDCIATICAGDCCAKLGQIYGVTASCVDTCCVIE